MGCKFLEVGFIGKNSAWIGFYDFDINDMEMHDHGGSGDHDLGHYGHECQWKWYDDTVIDFTHWRSWRAR